MFPSWYTMQREVILFCAGLMKDSTPLVQFIYEMQVEEYLRQMRTGHKSSIDANLFESLYRESTVKWPDHPLHNEYMNYYDHRWSTTQDTTPIYFPSRVYHFESTREAVVVENHLSAATKIPNCAMYMDGFDEEICGYIFKKQVVTDLTISMTFIHSTKVPTITNARSLRLNYCHTSYDFMRSLLQQLFVAGDSLEILWLKNTDLSPFEPLLDELLEDLVAHHEAQKGQRKLELELELDGTDLYKDFTEKWNQRCMGIESIYCEIRGDDDSCTEDDDSEHDSCAEDGDDEHDSYAEDGDDEHDSYAEDDEDEHDSYAEDGDDEHDSYAEDDDDEHDSYAEDDDDEHDFYAEDGDYEHDYYTEDDDDGLDLYAEDNDGEHDSCAENDDE